MDWKAWGLAARPKTLTASVVPILTGTALAKAMQAELHPGLALAALFSAVLIQIGTNLVNDAMDFKKGADTGERIGPKRVTQSGLLTSRQVLAGALICFGLATLLAIPLVIQGGWTIVAIGLASLLCGYCYTGGPFPLAYLGLGDVFVLIFFGWVAVAGTYYLHARMFDWEALVAGTQVGLLATVLIAINNLRDLAGDSKVGKKTLAVYFGAGFVRWEIAVLCVLPPMMGHFWRMKGFVWAAFLPLAVLPRAMRLAVAIFRTDPGPVYNEYLGRAAQLHLLFGILLALGLWIG